MNPDHIYETETMAELCTRQGRLGEAIAIYRRLTEVVDDVGLRARFLRRLTSLQSRWQPPAPSPTAASELPLPRAPGVSVLVGDEQVTVAWSVLPGTPTPTLDLLLLQRTSSGIETSKRVIALPTTTGRIGVAASAVHSAAAAVGTLIGDRFVPLARSPRG
jgi:hypothetical protein